MMLSTVRLWIQGLRKTAGDTVKAFRLFSRFLPYLRRHVRKIVFLLTMTTVSSLLGMLMPLVVRFSPKPACS